MDLPSLSPKEAMKEYASIESTYPTWKDTQLWLEDVRHWPIFLLAVVYDEEVDLVPASC